MMKKCKRLLSLLLALTMVLTTMGMEAFGAQATEGQVIGITDQNTAVTTEEDSAAETTVAVENTVAEETAAAVETTVTEDPVVAAESTVSEETAAAVETIGTEETEASVLPEVKTKHEILDDLHNQYATVLYKEGRLSVENDAAEFTVDEKNDLILVSGKYKNLKNAKFLIAKEYDFSDAVIGRFSVDMMAQKRTSITVGFYLDDDTEPFATTTLNRVKKEDDWSYRKNVSFDIYERKITGKHSISFAVLENEKTPDKVKFAFEAFEFVKSSVPVIYFDLDESEGTIAEMNSDSNHETECYGNMNIRVPEGYTGEYASVKAGLQTYELEYIRGRGNSTWMADKKPYKVKLAKKADLLGMGKQKHWVLLANYYDNSLLRNKMTYWMGEGINALIPEAYEYTPASVPVDVVMNGQYYGSYYLCEQIRVGENRVDIKNLEDTPEATEEVDISGGYLLSLSPYGDEDKASFTTKDDNEFLVECPDFEGNVNKSQLNYIKNYVQKTEDAINGANFKAEDGTPYSDLMDVTSAAYYYLMQEFSMNGDGFISTSTYLYKKPDVYDENGVLVEKGKLYWGPLWDFDYVAWGSTEYDEMDTEGWYLSERVWFSRLLSDTQFAESVAKDAWPQLKAKLQEAIADGGQLDQYYAQLESSADYNFEKWGFTFFMDDDDSDEDDDEEEDDENTRKALTYAEELTRLKTWISKRIEWVDDNIDSLIPKECVVTFPGTKLSNVTGVQGKSFINLPKAPSKKGYTFQTWQISYKYTYKEFMKAIGFTSYSELVAAFGKKTASDIKKNGYTESYFFSKGDSLPMVDSVEMTAVYIKNSDIIQPTKLYFKFKQLNYFYYDIGDEYSVSLGTIPFDADTCVVKWSTSDPSVVSVKDGYITIEGVGSAKITAKTDSGLSVSCKVKVFSEAELDAIEYSGLFVEDFTLSASSVTLDVDGYKKLNINVYPSTALTSYIDIGLISSDSSIVEIDSAGILHALREGSCIVYTYYNEIFRACKVTVKDSKKIHTGDTFTRKGLKYKVTSASARTVTCLGASKKTVSSVTIPGSFTYKGKKLKVTSIKAEAFKSYKNLKTVVIGSNVKTIGKKAFYNCQKLTTVTIGKSVISEGSQAFYNCKSLKTLRIKAVPHKVYSKAYSKIKSSVKIYVPKKWVSYYKTFFKGKKVIGKY